MCSFYLHRVSTYELSHCQMNALHLQPLEYMYTCKIVKKDPHAGLILVRTKDLLGGGGTIQVQLL